MKGKRDATGPRLAARGYNRLWGIEVRRISGPGGRTSC